MRVLWLTNDLPPRAGGIEQFLHNLLLRVHPQDTVVLGPPHPDAAAHDRSVPYRVVRHDRRVAGDRHTLTAAVTLGRRHRPEVVVLGAAWPLGRLAAELRAALGAPVVALTHGLEAGLCSVGAGWVVRRLTADLDAVTVLSAYTERVLRPHLRAARVRRLPAGVDPELFHPARDGAAMRRRWGVPADVPLVGCISRLVPRKGQDTLLEVWPAVRRRHPDAELVLVGEGPLASRLRRRATRTPGARLVGPVSWAELPDAYAALDVFAMPCRTRWGGLDVEGLGIVYLEAQACGVPVVAGRSGGAPETVREAETGLVVDGRDPRAVTAAIVELLGDRDRRRRMGAAGRRWVLEQWSWQVVAGRLAALLEEVSAGHGAAPPAA